MGGYQAVYDKYKDKKGVLVSEEIEYSEENFNVFAHRQAVIAYMAEMLEKGIDNDFKPSNLKKC